MDVQEHQLGNSSSVSTSEAVIKSREEPNPRVTLHKILEGFDGECTSHLIPALTVFNVALPFIDGFKVELDLIHLEKLCRYVNWSLEQENPQYTYIACGFLRDNALPWIDHLKHLLSACLISMSKLRPELVADSKLLSIFLSTVVNLTTTAGWKIIHTDSYKSLEPGMAKLSKNLFAHMLQGGELYLSTHNILEAGLARPGKLALKKANLYALSTLARRPLIDNKSKDNEDNILQYIRQILTVPAYVYYVQTLCPETLDVSIFSSVVHALEYEESFYSCISGKDISIILSLLANLIQLGENCEEVVITDLFHSGFSQVIQSLLTECAAKADHTNRSHWHPVLGWVNKSIPQTFLNAAGAVKLQIEALWGPHYIQALFSPLFEYLKNPTAKSSDNLENLSLTNSQVPISSQYTSTSPSGGFKNGFMKVWRKITFVEQIANRKHNNGAGLLKFRSEITVKLAKVCQLYNDLISKFPLCKLDILTGLCFKQNSVVVSSLWSFLQLLGPDCGLRGWIDILLNETVLAQESILLLLTDTMIHFVTILDDQEMYEDEKIFKLDELAQMAHFMNNVCYRLISHQNHNRVRTTTWTSLKNLLTVLYRRDCRRKYCPDDHWLIDSSKMGHLVNDIEKGRKNAKRILLDMPHVLREEARVILFRKWATSEKTLNGNSMAGEHDLGVSSSGSALITIQRGRIVEDGYANLANLSPNALKGTIRVRFQNELGLDEAGIDQDGVFKEFLEETIKAVFNPSLNLFKATSENLLYPSPLSYLHENHLELFEFVGKMLAKAVYEGIVVDVHFAPFFLSQILGLQQAALFSAIDELQFLDRELHNSLSYLKHYQGNVQELELTFSVDQDVLGEIRTTELIPGGKTIPVTSDNKINYLYLMAYFHLFTQIKDQTAAFLKGFRSIIPNEWLRIFSIPELQRLISGEDSDIDLADLRRNTQYYGGFHDNHRVVGWLWEILDSDFTEEERKLFLKFVTSCSKPPLLGFMNLDPPFSIRCVEVSDDDDTGDTIGSVLRGFLALGKKEPIGRLPTAATCFNLLKLPNYQKKSTLRDKLKYAVNANVGFELS